MTSPASPVALLEQRLAADAAAPLVTFYDDATGERAELSATTLATWVAKTAYLLVDDLLAGPGSTVRVDLPLHWQTVVWHLACWRVGATLLLPDADGEVDVLVTTAEALRDADVAAGEVVVLGLRPLAMPGADVPPGTLDYDTEVRGHGDRYDGPPPPPGAAVLRERGAEVTWRELLDRVDAAAPLPGQRVLTTLDPGTAAGLVAVVAPLVTAGSVVLVRNAHAPAGIDHVAAEAVTAVAVAATAPAPAAFLPPPGHPPATPPGGR